MTDACSTSYCPSLASVAVQKLALIVLVVTIDTFSGLASLALYKHNGLVHLISCGTMTPAVTCHAAGLQDSGRRIGCTSFAKPVSTVPDKFKVTVRANVMTSYSDSLNLYYQPDLQIAR